MALRNRANVRSFWRFEAFSSRTIGMLWHPCKSHLQQIIIGKYVEQICSSSTVIGPVDLPPT